MAKKIFDLNMCKNFIDSANPHQWLLTADNLHEQAVALFDKRDGSKLILRMSGQKVVSWDIANRAIFLLGAFALENAIKAFLVYEFPQWIENGTLHNEIKSHKLVFLSEKSSIIPYRARDRWILEQYEAGNESWMRYPCGVDADNVYPEQQMHERLWAGYRRVMRGYGRKMKRLLGRGWTGPNGYYAEWKMTGDWLS